MPDFNSSITIAASRQQVFDFVSDIGNLPKYLPTVKQAQDAGPSRVQVTGTVSGETYTQDGIFETPGPDQPIRWGSDGDKDYHGQMQLSDENGQTVVTLQLHLNPPPADKEGIEDRTGDFEKQMQEGVERCLQSIKQNVEGTGGKDEIPESKG